MFLGEFGFWKDVGRRTGCEGKEYGSGRRIGFEREIGFWEKSNVGFWLTFLEFWIGNEGF